MRWISSRNRTSPSESEDRIAARSPACWMAGPLLRRSGAFISAATIMARVVLPRPGGPENSTWSAVRPRIREAWSTSESCLRTRCWPTKSSRFLGRSAASMARSSGSSPAATSDGSATAAYAVACPGTVLAQPAERGAQDLRNVAAEGDLRLVGQGFVDAARRVLFGPAKAGHRGDHLRLPGGLGGRGGAGRGSGPVWNKLAGQLQHDPARHLGTDPRNLGERLAVPRVRGNADRLRLMDGQHGEGKPGADAADTEQDVENLAFVVGGEAEKRQRILPDDQGREELSLFAHMQPAEG